MATDWTKELLCYWREKYASLRNFRLLLDIISKDPKNAAGICSFIKSGRDEISLRRSHVLAVPGSSTGRRWSTAVPRPSGMLAPRPALERPCARQPQRAISSGLSYSSVQQALRSDSTRACISQSVSVFESTGFPCRLVRRAQVQATGRVPTLADGTDKEVNNLLKS